MSPPPSFDRPVILTLLGCFWPGNDASGPNQSFRALAEALSDRFDFRLVARDRPIGAEAGAAPSTDWTDLGFARVKYCPVGPFGARGLGSILSQTPHHALWLNSVFDREFTLPALALRRLGRVGKQPALLSPRGEFGSGALGIKSTKKQIFLETARRLNVWRDVTLHATSEAEARDMAAGVRGAAPIVVAPNIRLPLPVQTFWPSDGGALRLTFVGRIVPVKNLDFALRVLSAVTARVSFDIFGPAEDAGYWRSCQELMRSLPPNVSALWRGEASNSDVVAAMGRTDLFFLPTGGENFGHAIFEALSSGAPALISDQTPWRDLQATRAGWDLPLADPRPWAQAIESFAKLPAIERASFREGAAAHARQWFATSGAVERSADMLSACVGSAR